MNQKVIRIQFTDFWPNFKPSNFYLYNILTKKYTIEISDSPDILFYSVYSKNHYKYNCTKVFFTGENIRPNFSECDFAFSFDYSNDSRNYRLPLFAIYDDVNKLIRKGNLEAIKLREKKKFCCFIVSNPSNEIRNNFFKLLSKYKHVDSAGSLYNNIGGPVEIKRDFIKDYKFVIAFENSSHPGYVTEKIFEPLLENCIPIYWGTDTVTKDFNPKRFINFHDFNSPEEVVKHILEIDNDDQKYLEYLNEPSFLHNELPNYLKEENILQKLEIILNEHLNRNSWKKMQHYMRPLLLISLQVISKVQDKTNTCKFWS